VASSDAREPAAEDLRSLLEVRQRRPLVALVRLRLRSRPEVDGRHPERGEPGDVRPRLLRLDDERARRAQRLDQRVRGERGRRRRQVREADLRPSRDEREDRALRVLQRAIRREAVVQVELEPVRDDVSPTPARGERQLRQ
jgi:hypothetical protein